MNLLEFYTVLIVGILLGGFFYHIFINKLINNPKYQKLKEFKKMLKDGEKKS